MTTIVTVTSSNFIWVCHERWMDGTFVDLAGANAKFGNLIVRGLLCKCPKGYIYHVCYLAVTNLKLFAAEFSFGQLGIIRMLRYKGILKKVMQVLFFGLIGSIVQVTMILCFRTCFIYCFLRFTLGDPIIYSRLLITSQSEVSMSKHKQTEHSSSFLSLSYLCVHIMLVGVLIMQDHRSNPI